MKEIIAVEHTETGSLPERLQVKGRCGTIIFEGDMKNGTLLGTIEHSGLLDSVSIDMVLKDCRQLLNFIQLQAHKEAIRDGDGNLLIKTEADKSNTIFSLGVTVCLREDKRVLAKFFV
jgi:hypothetical protein